MRLILSILTGAAAASFATGLGAQEKKPAPKKEPAPKKQLLPGADRCVTEDGKVVCSSFNRFFNDSALMKRAALGIHLGATGSLRDTIGVFVTRVTPKGPAENAGIIEGDRIMSINGVDLRVNPADAGDSYASGLPSRRLTREVAKVSPGSVVNLRVYSGGRIRDVRVTAARASDLRESGFGMFPGGFGPGYIMGEMPNMERMRIERLYDLDELRPQFERLRQELPRLQLELGERMRLLEKLNDPSLRLEALPRLRDGMRVRALTPLRVRHLRPDMIYFDADGDLIYESERKAKVEEKLKTEKEKRSKK